MQVNVLGVGGFKNLLKPLDYHQLRPRQLQQALQFYPLVTAWRGAVISLPQPLFLAMSIKPLFQFYYFDWQSSRVSPDSYPKHLNLRRS